LVVNQLKSRFAGKQKSEEKVLTVVPGLDLKQITSIEQMEEAISKQVSSCYIIQLFQLKFLLVIRIVVYLNIFHVESDKWRIFIISQRSYCTTTTIFVGNDYCLLIFLYRPSILTRTIKSASQF